MNPLEGYASQWGSLSGSGIWLIVGIIAIIFMAWFVYKLSKNLLKRASGEVAAKQKVWNMRQPVPVENIATESDDPDVPDVVKEGIFGAYLLNKNEECMEAIKIPEPIGNGFMADTSMPVPGFCYLVIGTPDGQKEVYDPYNSDYDFKKSPQYAFFATHWEVVFRVYASVKKWWQMAPAWVFVASLIGSILIVFVVAG